MARLEDFRRNRDQRHAPTVPVNFNQAAGQGGFLARGVGSERDDGRKKFAGASASPIELDPMRDTLSRSHRATERHERMLIERSRDGYLV